MAVWQMINRSKKIHNFVSVIIASIIIYLLFSVMIDRTFISLEKRTKHIVYDRHQKEYVYDNDSPLIFVGGVPRSGTTLMRVLLDAHPDVRCGEETRLLPMILSIHMGLAQSNYEKQRLREAGIGDDVVDAAVSAFMLEIMARHGEPAKRLCNKDPFLLQSMAYLNSVFPNGKYILMIRDGRATVHSIISRRVRITGYNITNYTDCLIKWNRNMDHMYRQCHLVGSMVCLPVYYERLVLDPGQVMKTVLKFLGIHWNERVLHHEDVIGLPDGISLSKKERSTDQVVRPINRDALTKWVGHIPSDVTAQLLTIAPMLHNLGYDLQASNYADFNPPPMTDQQPSWIREGSGLAVNAKTRKWKASPERHHRHEKGGHVLPKPPLES